VNIVDLAGALSTVLSASLPPEVEVRAEGSAITITKLAGYSAGGQVTFDLDGRALAHGGPAGGVWLDRAVHDLLDVVQDTTAEATGQPWPGVTTMPVPLVVLDGELLTLSYVDAAGHPVLDLGSVDVADRDV